MIEVNVAKKTKPSGCVEFLFLSENSDILSKF